MTPGGRHAPVDVCRDDDDDDDVEARRARLAAAPSRAPAPRAGGVHPIEHPPTAGSITCARARAKYRRLPRRRELRAPVYSHVWLVRVFTGDVATMVPVLVTLSPSDAPRRATVPCRTDPRSDPPRARRPRRPTPLPRATSPRRGVFGPAAARAAAVAASPKTRPRVIVDAALPLQRHGAGVTIRGVLAQQAVRVDRDDANLPGRGSIPKRTLPRSRPTIRSHRYVFVNPPGRRRRTRRTRRPRWRGRDTNRRSRASGDGPSPHPASAAPRR